MKKLFLLLRQLLNGIAGVKWVDRDYGQLDNYTESPDVPFPCALFKIAMTTETIGSKTQICTGTVTIRIAVDNPAIETAAASSDVQVNRSLQYYDLNDAAFALLQNYTDGFITNFDRLSQLDEDRKDGLSVMKTVWNCSFIQTAS